MKLKLAITLTLLLVATLLLSSCNLLPFGTKYTVNFDANGGEIVGESSVTVNEQSMLDLPYATREGYIFIGWYAGEGVNEAKFTSTTPVTFNITLKAKWINENDITNNGVKIDIHTVTYNANGGAMSGDTTIYAQTYSTLNLPVPTMEGYVFLGWYVGEGTNEALFTASSLVTNNITLNAKWAKAEHTVTFIDYYGNTISRETVKYGDSATAPAVPRIADEKLRFDAWDTEFDVITSDLEVKALYVLDAYTITYVTNNSQTIPATSYFFDEIPRTPSTPGLAGHHFIGWYLDEAFTQEYLFDMPLTSDITLYAYFNESIPIETIDDLMAIEQYSTNSYFLKNDIDCEGAVINGTILDFAGTFDGEGHTIYNFVYQPAEAENVGLFATNAGTIKNVNFKEFSYTLTHTNIDSNSGLLVGKNTGTIENVHISDATISFTGQCIAENRFYSFYHGSITGNNAGSVINCSTTNTSANYKVYSEAGRNNNARPCLYAGALVGINSGNVKNSITQTTSDIYMTNIVTASYYTEAHSYLCLGGLVSVNDGTVSNCEATVETTASLLPGQFTHGFIGGFACVNNNNIESCSATAKINQANIPAGSASVDYNAAGFALDNYGTIKNSYANVDIESLNDHYRYSFGGFIVNNYAGIDHCYVTGKINVKSTLGKGGFAGYNNGNINSCFADVDIFSTDTTLCGPFVGEADAASNTINCYYSNEAVFTANGEPMIFDVTHAEAIDTLSLCDSEFIVGTLGWSEDVWAFDESKFEYPTLK